MNFVLRVVSGPEGLGEKLNFASDRPFVVGREQGCDAVFSGDLLLSSTHFSVVSSSGDVFLTDLASTNGTYLNDTRVLRAQVYLGDRIRAGKTIFELAQEASVALPNVTPLVAVPAERLTIASQHGDERVVRLGERLTVGRTDMAVWVFPDDLKMSSAHFSIELQDKSWELRDLNSTNGTIINHKTTTVSTLQTGDSIIAGSTQFSIRIFSPEPSKPSSITDIAVPETLAEKPLVDSRIRETTDWLATPAVPTVIEGSASQKPELKPSGKFPFEPSVPTKSEFKAPTDLSPIEPPQRRKPEPSVPFRITLNCLTDPSLSADYDCGQELTIGRDPQNDLAFPFDVLISGTHARLRVLDNQVVLQDLHSTNGTLVNGVRIHEQVLQNGGSFIIGKQSFQIGFVGQKILSEPIEAPLPPLVASEPNTTKTSLSNDDVKKGVHSNSKPGADRIPLGIDSDLPIADLEIPFEAFQCGSGLMLFGGCIPNFDPIDIARRLTLATPGWLMRSKSAKQINPDKGLEQHTIQHELSMELISATDPSWMIPWSQQWGTQKTLIVYSRSEPEAIKDAITSICGALDSATHEIPAHDKMYEFLANRLSDTIARIFAPLDAVLIELYSGKQWAYFAPKDMEATLRQLRFRKKHRW